jgi:hypothetical protein
MNFTLPIIGPTENVPVPDAPMETHELTMDVKAEALPENVYLDNAQTTQSCDQDYLGIDLTICVDGVKLIKRVLICKRGLAEQAKLAKASATVVESDDPDVTAAEDAVFAERETLRKIAGLKESAGKKCFDVLFSYADKDGSRASRTVKISHVTDAAHARQIFNNNVAKKFNDTKITRTTEVKE